MALMSIIAITNHDPAVWNGFKVPGLADITSDALKDPHWVPDRQAAIDYILTSCGEMSLVYTDPAMVRHMIRMWTIRRFPVWAALYNSTLYKYNPIWNKDGTITEERDLAETDDESTTGSLTTGRTITDDEDTTSYMTIVDDEDTSGSVSSIGTTDADIKGNVTAFDSNTYSPNDQQVQDIDTTSNAMHTGARDLTRTETGSGSRDLTRTDNGSEDSTGTRDRDRTEKEKTVRVEQGNIGVTTTQQMIKEQRESVMFSLYDVIMQDFKHEFCVMVY